MGDDNEIAVQLTAKTADFNARLLEAVHGVRESTEGIREELKKVKESSEETESALKKLLSIETFNFLREQAERAFEAIKGGFEATIGKAEEFGLSNAKFAAMMGTSEEEAAGLSAALRGVGSSAEEFESMALRLEMRLNTNEKGMREMGIATRDSSGNLLTGKELMDSAIKTMSEYKSGTDQNAFALEVFGKRASAIYDIMRVGDEQVNHQIEIYKEFGVNLSGTGESSEQLEEKLNDLHTMVEALGLALGQKLMPAATSAIGWLGGEGKGLVEAIEVSVKALESTLLALKASVTTAVVAITALFVELWDTVKLTGKLIYDVMTGNFSDVVSDYKKGSDEMADDLSAAGRVIADEWKQVGAVWDDTAKKGEALGQTNPYKKDGGTKSFTPPAKKGANDKSGDEAIHGAEQLALAKIAIEEQTNAHLLAMGHETDAVFVAQARALENETYAVKLAALTQELAIHGKSKAEKQKLNDEIAVLEVTHQGALLKIDQAAESQRASLSKESLANALRDADERLRVGKESLAEMASAGRISLEERDVQEMALTQTVRREELARLNAALATLTPGTKAYEDMIRQREALEKQFTADLKSLNAQRRTDAENTAKNLLAPFTSGFKSAFNGILFQGKSFEESMKGFFVGIGESFAQTLEGMAEKWLTLQLTNALIGETTGGAMARTEIAASAAAAGAAAYAATVSIPVVGLAAAPAAGAAAYGEAIAYQALVPSAAGGMVLDRDSLVFAHTKEMVLPANLSQGIQNLITGGNTSTTKGGDNVVHYAPTIHSNQKDLVQLIREQPMALVAAIKQLSRDGHFRSR